MVMATNMATIFAGKSKDILRSNNVEGRLEAGSIKCRELQVQAIHYPQKVQGPGRHLQGTHHLTLWGLAARELWPAGGRREVGGGREGVQHFGDTTPTNPDQGRIPDQDNIISRHNTTSTTDHRPPLLYHLNCLPLWSDPPPPRV